MIIYYFYTFCFIALSGFGVTFQNPESILAFCFFIFFALVLNQSGPLGGQGLEHSRQAIQAEFISCLLDAQKHSLAKRQFDLFKKAQLLASARYLGN